MLWKSLEWQKPQEWQKPLPQKPSTMNCGYTKGRAEVAGFLLGKGDLVVWLKVGTAIIDYLEAAFA